MSLVLKIKKIKEGGMVPQYAHRGDAALDLFASEAVTLAPMERKAIPTGIAMEIPEGFVGLIWDKSGLSMKNGLKTLGGVVDSTYRGEVLVGMINLSQEAYTFEAGHKIAQMIIQKKEDVLVEEMTELSDTARGERGFGSTGK